MDNPTPKKRFPWGCAALGCGAVAIIVLAVGVVLVVKAMPSVQSALANLDAALGSAQAQAPEVVPTLAPLLIPTQAPQVNQTQVPNPGGGSGSSSSGLPFKFSAVQDASTLTGQSLMDQMTTGLNLNNDTDFMAPKTYTGSATLDPTSSFTLGNGWCAANTATLQQNLANMQFQLSINGQSIDLSQYPTLYFSDNQGDACAMTGISITPSGNLSGSYHVVLTEKYLTSLSDGISSSPYPAGDVTFDFNFVFKVPPAPGSNT